LQQGNRIDLLNKNGFLKLYKNMEINQWMFTGKPTDRGKLGIKNKILDTNAGKQQS